MPSKVKRPCAVCGKECEPHQRNTDGTYLHDQCAYHAAPLVGLWPLKKDEQ